MNGVYTILPLYLSQYFDSVKLGYLMMIQPLLLCIAPFFWGGITDRAKSQNLVLALLTTGAALAFAGITFNNNFLWVAAMLVLYALFQAPYGALVDVLTINSAGILKINYGTFRIMGTLGYGICAYIVTLSKNTESAFAVYVAVAILSVISVLLMPKAGAPRRLKQKKEKGEENLFKNKELMTLILIITASYFAWGYYTNFFPTYITESLGMDKSRWGIIAFLTAFSEVPFFIYYSKIFEKISIRNILIITGITLILRFLVFSFVTNIVVLIIVCFVTGLFITVNIYCVTIYITKAIAPGMINRAQNMAYAIGTGIPKMLAGCIGGYMTKFLGEKVSFVLCAALCFAALVATLLSKKTMENIDKKVRKLS